MTNRMSEVVFIQYLQNLRVGPGGIIKYLTHTTLFFYMERGSEWVTVCCVSMSLHSLGHICLKITMNSAVFSELSFWPFQNESPSELFVYFMLLKVILRC